MVLADDVMPVRRSLLLADATGSSLGWEGHEGPLGEASLNIARLDTNTYA